jgi:hypothetical protein
MILIPLALDYNSREAAAKRPPSRPPRRFTLRGALAVTSIAFVVATLLYVVMH